MRLAKFLGALIVTVLLLTTQVQAFIFQGLGDLPGGTFQSLAYGVSNDGTSVVGYSSAYYSSSLNRCPNRQFMITRSLENGVTLPSVKTTYTERRSPDGEQVQESRKPG